MRRTRRLKPQQQKTQTPTFVGFKVQDGVLCRDVHGLLGVSTFTGCCSPARIIYKVAT